MQLIFLDIKKNICYYLYLSLSNIFVCKKNWLYFILKECQIEILPGRISENE